MHIKKILFIFFITLSNCRAEANWTFPLYIVLDNSNYTLNGTTTSNIPSTTFGLGGGAGVDYKYNDSNSFEFDALYVNRKNTFNISYFEFPLLYRMWFGPYFNAGLGGYYALAYGNVSFSNGASESLSDAGIDQSDYGVLASVVLNIPISSIKSDFIIDARYEYGLHNISTVSNVTAKYDDLQFLIGVRLNSFP